MADEPPPMDFPEEDEEKAEDVEKEMKQSPESPPASLKQEHEEVVEKKDPPPKLEPEPETTPVNAAPPPTLEAHAADEGDEAPVAKPVVPQQPQRTLDLFEEDDTPPAPSADHVSSQVYTMCRSVASSIIQHSLACIRI